MMGAATIAGQTGHTVSTVDVNAFRSLYLSGGNRGKHFRKDGADFFLEFFLCLLPLAGPNVVNAFPE